VFTIFLSCNIHRSCGSKLVQFPVLRTGGVISQYMRFVAPLVPFSPISYQLLQGGSLAKHALFTVANLVLNLFKFSSSALIFPLESYSFITSLRAAVTDTSTSQSARL
jgi:hypothetical protein